MSASHDPIGENGLDTSNDATPAQLGDCITAIPENSSGMIDYFVNVRRVSNGAAKFILLRVTFKRGTGDAEITTESQTLLASVGDLSALLLATVNAQVSGSNIQVMRTGLTGVELDWSALAHGKKLVHS